LANGINKNAKLNKYKDGFVSKDLAKRIGVKYILDNKLGSDPFSIKKRRACWVIMSNCDRLGGNYLIEMSIQNGEIVQEMENEM